MPLRREEGQTMAEYGVVLGVLVIVTMVAYIALGDAAAGLIERVGAVL
jgi:Flp pilus assembly pilin Flp